MLCTFPWALVLPQICLFFILTAALLFLLLHLFVGLHGFWSNPVDRAGVSGWVYWFKGVEMLLLDLRGSDFCVCFTSCVSCLLLRHQNLDFQFSTLSNGLNSKNGCREGSRKITSLSSPSSDASSLWIKWIFSLFFLPLLSKSWFCNFPFLFCTISEQCCFFLQSISLPTCCSVSQTLTSRQCKIQASEGRVWGEKNPIVLEPIYWAKNFRPRNTVCSHCFAINLQYKRSQQ